MYKEIKRYSKRQIINIIKKSDKEFVQDILKYIKDNVK